MDGKENGWKWEKHMWFFALPKVVRVSAQASEQNSRDSMQWLTTFSSLSLSLSI